MFAVKKKVFQKNVLTPNVVIQALNLQEVELKKIEEVLGKLCPNAKIVRMDSDSMRRKDSYEKVFSKFRTGKIDILIGTQMIAKGLDFPNVTLVGVTKCNLSLYVQIFVQEKELCNY